MNIDEYEIVCVFECDVVCRARGGRLLAVRLFERHWQGGR